LTPLPEKRDSVLIFLKSQVLAGSLKTALEMRGHRTTTVSTEAGAFAEARGHVPSMIILDRRSRSIRNFRRMDRLTTVPIVTVQEGQLPYTDEECLQEYDQGIDLVASGHSVRELVARVRAILRRRETGAHSNITYTAGTTHMDLERHEVRVNGRP